MNDYNIVTIVLNVLLLLILQLCLDQFLKFKCNHTLCNDTLDLGSPLKSHSFLLCFYQWIVAPILHIYDHACFRMYLKEFFLSSFFLFNLSLLKKITYIYACTIVHVPSGIC